MRRITGGGFTGFCAVIHLPSMFLDRFGFKPVVFSAPEEPEPKVMDEY